MHIDEQAKGVDFALKCTRSKSNRATWDKPKKKLRSMEGCCGCLKHMKTRTRFSARTLCSSHDQCHLLHLPGVLMFLNWAERWLCAAHLNRHYTTILRFCTCSHKYAHTHTNDLTPATCQTQLQSCWPGQVSLIHSWDVAVCLGNEHKYWPESQRSLCCALNSMSASPASRPVMALSGCKGFVCVQFEGIMRRYDGVPSPNTPAWFFQKMMCLVWCN